MNLGQLRDLARFRLQDVEKPYLWPTDFINAALNEAQQEACMRARLIEDQSSSLTEVDVTTTSKRYALDPRILDVICIERSDGTKASGWTLTESELVFDDLPNLAETLWLTVIRLPMEDMADDNDEPEIRPALHQKLVDWVLHRCYEVNDADGLNMGASEKYEAQFSRSFGIRQDFNVQRKHRDKGGRTVRIESGW